MPNHKTHEFFGLSVWIFFLAFIVTTYAMSYEKMFYTAVVGFGFCFTGSIFADIDNKSSVMFRHVRLILSIVSFSLTFITLAPFISNKLSLMMICGAVTLIVITVMHIGMPKHRGIVHTFKIGLLYAVCSLIGSYTLLYDITLSIIIATFSFFSYSTHLVLDKM